MRLTIRWKMILALGLPMLGLYAAMLAWDFHRERAAATEQMRRLVASGASGAASRLDVQLRSLMQLGESTALFLSTRNVLTPLHLNAILRGDLRQNPRATAVCIALERGVLRGRDERSVWTIRRGRGRPQMREITRRFDPEDEHCQWYRNRRRQEDGGWTEPYADPNLGGRFVCTYATPFKHNDTYAGVVAITIELATLQQMLNPPPRPPSPFNRANRRRRPDGGTATEARPAGPARPLRNRDDEPSEPPDDDNGQTDPPSSDELDGDAESPEVPQGPSLAWSLAMGERTPFIVLDAGGRILSHPKGDMHRSESVFIRAEQRGLTNVIVAGQEAADGRTEIVYVDLLHELAPGFVDPGRYWMAMAPISSSGWIFVTALPESRLMDPVLARLRNRTLFLLGGLVLLIGLVVWTSVRITGPIRKLAGAVQDVGRGNLDIQVTGDFAHDEVGQLAAGFNNMVRQLKDHIRALTRETSLREKVDSELRIARQIQEDLLPKTFPPFPDRTEFDLHAINKPARRVAGDFFDFFFTEDGRLTIVVADVSGKGVPAALLMAVTRTVVRNLSLAGLEPEEVIEQANAMLVADTSDAMFVTLFLAQYDPATGEVVYVNAGHPRPYVVGPAGKPRPFGDVTAPLLGITDDYEMGPFASARERLNVGETLVVFTDGVTEARAPDGRMLTDTGLETLIAAYSETPVDDLCRHLADELDDYQHRHRADDVTLLALKRNR